MVEGFEELYLGDCSNGLFISQRRADEALQQLKEIKERAKEKIRSYDERLIFLTNKYRAGKISLDVFEINEQALELSKRYQENIRDNAEFLLFDPSKSKIAYLALKNKISSEEIENLTKISLPFLILKLNIKYYNEKIKELYRELQKELKKEKLKAKPKIKELGKELKNKYKEFINQLKPKKGEKESKKQNLVL